MRRRTSAPLLLAACLLASCGPKAEGPRRPDRGVTAEDEIFAAGHVWQAMEEQRGVRGAPEKIARFEIKQRSTLTLERGTHMGTERIERKEVFELRSGAVYECVAKSEMKVRVRYGRRQGNPAVEVMSPSRTLRRECRPSDFPEPEVTLPGGSSRFRLDDAQLVGFAPLSEKRVFLSME
jgi:hypothetical protein